MLGEGTSGRVYLGRHHRLGRAVAIKVLHAQHTQDAALLQRFFLEARTVAQINHEHIVEVYDFVEQAEPRSVYCVMELLTGATLAARCKDAPFALDTVLRIARQIAAALGAAHAVGVVHRDLKPDNVYLVQRGGSEDFVKVLDFGVAKLLTRARHIGTNDTQAGALIGTPRYMSPEQAAGLEVDQRSDIYALGTLLYELLTGHVPFEAEAIGPLISDVLTRSPPPLTARTLRGDRLPASLSELTMACLSKQPPGRPASMAEVISALSSAAPLAAPAERRGRWRRRAGVGLTVSALALLGTAVSVGSGRARPALLAAPALALTTPPPALAPARVSLIVTTSRPGAQVTRSDTDALLGATPLDISVERSAKPVQLLVRLAGFEPIAREVTFDSNQRLELSLSPRASLPPRGPARPTKATPSALREGVVDPFDE